MNGKASEAAEARLAGSGEGELAVGVPDFFGVPAPASGRRGDLAALAGRSFRAAAAMAAAFSFLSAASFRAAAAEAFFFLGGIVVAAREG